MRKPDLEDAAPEPRRTAPSQAQPFRRDAETAARAAYYHRWQSRLSDALRTLSDQDERMARRLAP